MISKNRLEVHSESNESQINYLSPMVVNRKTLPE